MYKKLKLLVQRLLKKPQPSLLVESVAWTTNAPWVTRLIANGQIQRLEVK